MKIKDPSITLAQTIKKIDGAYAPATIRAYKADFQQFIDYCEINGESALPTHPITVATHITYLVNKNYSSAYIRRIVASIATIHQLNHQPIPTRDPEVNLALRRMHRQLGRHSHQAQGVTKTILDQMINATDNSLRGLRDRALLLVAYDTLCRRGELTALRVEDINVNPIAQLVTSVTILLRRSKTDQDAQGRWLHLSSVAWQALEAWLKAANIRSGPVFRGVRRGNKVTDDLGAGQISRIYKRLARTAGLGENITQHISGHSMRVGAAQDLLLSGASLPIIMARGRWSKTDTVMRYIEQTALPV